MPLSHWKIILHWIFAHYDYRAIAYNLTGASARDQKLVLADIVLGAGQTLVAIFAEHDHSAHFE